MTLQDRAVVGGDPERALLKIYWELGYDQCDKYLSSRGEHIGIPLKSWHLLESKKAPSPPEAQQCALVG